VPTFHIQSVESRPDGMVSVRLATGEAGYIPIARLEEFKQDYPDAIVIE
jgi:hypothetical protein